MYRLFLALCVALLLPVAISADARPGLTDTLAQPAVCETRADLREDGSARVAPEGLPVTVRSGATTRSLIIGELPPGAVVQLMEGPICSDDGLAWWRVRAGNLSGFVAESSPSVIFLQDYPSERVTVTGVELRKFDAVSAGITASVVPADEDYPAHRLLTFEGYSVPVTGVAPTLRVIPIEGVQSGDYPTLQAQLEAVQTVPSLEAIQSDTPRPPLEGEETEDIVVQVDDVRTFATRYVLHLRDGTDRLTAGDLLYRYVGVSPDGRYLITATLPVDATPLQATVPGVFFDGYYDQLRYQLGIAQPEAFTPNLRTLDALVGSVLVVGDVGG